MIGLHSRLNERDQQLANMQQEQQSAEKERDEFENQYRQMSARVKQLEDLLKKHNVKLPAKTAVLTRFQSQKSARQGSPLVKSDTISNNSASKPGQPREVFLRSPYRSRTESIEFYSNPSEGGGSNSPMRKESPHDLQRFGSMVHSTKSQQEPLQMQEM